MSSSSTSSMRTTPCRMRLPRYLARQILQSAAADRVPKVITTLHGTDITLVGSDHSYAETVAFSIDQSDGVTAVSESLKAETYRMLPVRNDNRGDSEFSRLRDLPPDARPAPPRAVLSAGMRESGHPRLQLPTGETGHGRRGNIREDCGKDSVAAAAGRRRSGFGRRTRYGACTRTLEAGGVGRRAGPDSAAAVDLRICSCCPRLRRASAWQRSRRWRAKFPSSPPGRRAA